MEKESKAQIGVAGHSPSINPTANTTVLLGCEQKFNTIFKPQI